MHPRRKRTRTAQASEAKQRPRKQQEPKDVPKVADVAVTPGSSPRSQSLRKEGNNVYKQISEGGFGYTVRTMKFFRAQKLYMEALDESINSDDRASCFKNLGSLLCLWSKAELEQVVVAGGPSKPPEVWKLAFCRRYLSGSVDFILKAKEQGIRACKSQEWLDHLDSVLINMVDWATEQSGLLSLPHAPLLKYLGEAFDDALRSCPVQTEAAILAHKHHAGALFKHGIKSISEDKGLADYKKCLSLMRDCLQPLQRAKDLQATQMNKDLEEDVYLYCCISEAMQALALGDAALSKSMFEEEEVDIELVWDALDHYRQAALLTHEQDMESEAIAMSRIGKVYSDVLKMHDKAHKFHFQATKLGLAISSPRITRSDWYMHSCEKVKQHQERVVEEEEKEQDKARQPHLKKLQAKLEELWKEANKGTESFLRYIYMEHPHPNPTKFLGTLSSQERTKASLKKALCHYHPDANVKHGEEWKVLCEEISKQLNRKYECFKGCR